MARNVSLPIIASGALPLKEIKEWDFQVAVGKYAEAQGWRVHYAKTSGYLSKSGKWLSTSTGGWPDMFMVRDGEVVAAELKREVGGKAGRARPDQQEWLDMLEAVPGVSTALWKPSMAKEIMERLT